MTFLPAPSIFCRNLTRVFSTPPVTALTDIDLNLDGGSFTAVVGASGSGKSTLLRLLAGLDKPTSGSILLDGHSPEERRTAKEVGFMAQRPALLPWRTTFDNVELAQSINPHTDRPVPDPAELLAMVGLSEFLGAYPAQLSGGMAQRAALARTLAIGAPLWLMDEPFAALDEITRRDVSADLLGIWHRIRPTVVWVTHHLGEAVSLADRIVLLTPRPGRVAAIIEVDLERPRDDTSSEFQAIIRRARRILGEVERTAV